LEEKKKKMGLKEIKAQRRAEAELRKAANKALRDSTARLKAAEEQILRLETRQGELVAALENMGTSNSGSAFSLNKELAELQERLETVMKEWESLSSAIPAGEVPEMA
jgi:phage-related minor tail protein